MDLIIRRDQNIFRGFSMSGILGLGKISRKVFERSVFPFIPADEEPGLDGNTIRLNGRTVVAHSPSIGVPLDALGFFAFHYAATNVACRFGRPTHMVTGIYMPLRTGESDLRTIVKGLGDEARKYNVKVVAGQTATYHGLGIPLVTATCFGEENRRATSPSEGDAILLIGEIGGEAVWLKRLSEGRQDGRWRGFTPLETVLRLQDCHGVKLMHDISEGGLKGALFEVVENCGLGIDVSSSTIPLSEGAGELGGDILRAPTYGALVVVTSQDSAEDVASLCASQRRPCVHLCNLRGSKGLFVDGTMITEQKRVEIDEIYGTFERPEKK
jgi:hydrogenase maturation factor